MTTRCVEVTVNDSGTEYGAVHHVQLQRKRTAWLTASQALVGLSCVVAACFLLSAITEDRSWTPNVSLSAHKLSSSSSPNKISLSQPKHIVNKNKHSNNMMLKQQKQRMVSAKGGQELGGMQFYDESSGMLKTVFSEPGLMMKLYWSQPTDFSDSYNPAMNFRTYDGLEEQVGPDVPDGNSTEWGELLIVWRGRVEIMKGGSYTFKVETSSPANVRLSGDVIASSPSAAVITKDNVQLDSGYHKLIATWKAPVPYTDPVFVVTYSGPDTDGEETNVVGYHFDQGTGNLNGGLAPAGKAGDGTNGIAGASGQPKVREGWGLMVYDVFPPYEIYKDTETELPSVVDTYNGSLMTLCTAGKVRALDFRNHEEWVEALQDERFPAQHVVVQALSIFKIDQAGHYTFSLTSMDASTIEIDDDVIVSNEGKGSGELLHPQETTGTLFLEKGWHSARVMWFQNNTDNDYDSSGDWMLEVNEANGEHDGEGSKENRTWGVQVLIVKYAGPDTGGSDEFELLRGWHERGILALGSVRGIGLFGGSFSTKYGERNPLWEFDKRWLSGHKDKPWKKYDKADWQEEIGDPVTKIIKPYTDWTRKADAYQHSEVPESVYSHRPPYDHNVVDLGKSSVKWDHSNDADNGQAVIGKEYDGWDHQWFKTPNSVSPPSG